MKDGFVGSHLVQGFKGVFQSPEPQGEPSFATMTTLGDCTTRWLFRPLVPHLMPSTY